MHSFHDRIFGWFTTSDFLINWNGKLDSFVKKEIYKCWFGWALRCFHVGVSFSLRQTSWFNSFSPVGIVRSSFAAIALFLMFHLAFASFFFDLHKTNSSNSRSYMCIFVRAFNVSGRINFSVRWFLMKFHKTDFIEFRCLRTTLFDRWTLNDGKKTPKILMQTIMCIRVYRKLW